MTTYVLAPLMKYGLNMAVGDKLYTYAAGTVTPLAVHTDSTGTAQTNPAVADVRGELDVWIAAGVNYKFVHKTSADVTISTVDNIGIADSVGGVFTSITVNGNSVDGPTIGKHSVPVGAVSIKPSLTNGSADIFATTSGSGLPDIIYLAFDATTEESGQFFIAMPTNWNEGTITFKFHWAHPATTTNFGVVFGLKGLARSNDDAIGTAFGTEVMVTDTGGTTHDFYTSDESTAVTIGGTPAAGDGLFFKVSRKTGEAGDTMAVDAWLLGITCYFTTDTPVG